MNVEDKKKLLIYINENSEVSNFLNHIKITRNYTENTIISYEQELWKYFFFLKEHNIKETKITKENIRAYLKSLDEKHCKNTTISHNISVIRSYYNYLLLENKIKNNIWNQIKNPKIPKKLPNFLTTMEIEKLLKETDLNTPFEIRNRLIIELLFATGLRVSELVNIKISDISFEEKSIRTLGKGKKERIVYFGDYAKEMLQKYLEKSRNEFLNNKTSTYLLVGKNSLKLTRNRISEILEETVRKIGLQHHISPHVLRHTFATQLLNNGADIRSVQELLGHEKLSTTQIYTHITNDQLRKAYLDNMPRK